MSMSGEKKVPWYAALAAASSVQGTGPHHLDLWLDHPTRMQHLVATGGLDSLKSPSGTPAIGR